MERWGRGFTVGDLPHNFLLNTGLLNSQILHLYYAFREDKLYITPVAAAAACKKIFARSVPNDLALSTCLY
jgi:hypothetical protein